MLWSYLLVLIYGWVGDWIVVVGGWFVGGLGCPVCVDWYVGMCVSWGLDWLGNSFGFRLFTFVLVYFMCRLVVMLLGLSVYSCRGVWMNRIGRPYQK